MIRELSGTITSPSKPGPVQSPPPIHVPDQEKDIKRRYDQTPPWDKYLTFEASCNNGIQFSADTANSAILFTQPHDRLQPIKWYYRPEAGLPPREASLTVSPATGDMSFTGGAEFKGSLGARGLSGGGKPARNLRGLNVPVPDGSKEIAVKFPQPEADNAYMAVLQLSWLTNHAVVNRTAEGFTVQFATPPGANGNFPGCSCVSRFDSNETEVRVWVIVRPISFQFVPGKTGEHLGECGEAEEGRPAATRRVTPSVKTKRRRGSLGNNLSAGISHPREPPWHWRAAFASRV